MCNISYFIVSVHWVIVYRVKKPKMVTYENAKCDWRVKVLELEEKNGVGIAKKTLKGLRLFKAPFEKLNTGGINRRVREPFKNIS